MAQRIRAGEKIGFGYMALITILASDDYEPPLLEGKNGAVTCDVKECSAIGIDLLRDGGNAIDAAIGM